MVLCIDTCTQHAGVSLVQKKHMAGGQLRAVYKPLPQGRYAESLLMVVNKAFKAAKAAPADLTGVLVIKGPGSFTSLRIGIAVANQFAHQLKIPIVSLRTEEWWLSRTDVRPVMYLQSMNREQVYGVTGPKVILSTFASLSAGSAKKLPHYIIPLKLVTGEILRSRTLAQNDLWYLGQLTPEHKAALPSEFRPINKLRSPRETWFAVAQTIRWPRRQKTYTLVEPFYGKEPTITKSKRLTKHF